MKVFCITTGGVGLVFCKGYTHPRKHTFHHRDPSLRFGVSEKDYFGRFSNPGDLSSCPCTGRLAVQALGLAGAEGSTPKSQTYRLIWPFSSSSTTAYSPAVSGSSGVSLIHSPTGVAVVLTQFSFWVTLP